MGAKALAKMKDVFPSYDTDKRGIPVALCIKHWSALTFHRVDRPRWDRSELDALDNLFGEARKFRAAASPMLDPLSKHCQKHRKNPQYPVSNILQANSKIASEFERLKTPPKKRPRGSSSKLRRSPRLRESHLLHAGLESALSGRKMEKHTDALRAQRKRGEHHVNVPSGSSMRNSRYPRAEL